MVGPVPFVGQVRRSRHPAYRRLPGWGHALAALRLRGPTDPVQWWGPVPFVGRVRRSRHPQTGGSLAGAMPGGATLARAYGSSVMVGPVPFVGRVRRSRHPANRRLPGWGHALAALRLRGPTDPVQWWAPVPFVCRVWRSRHSANRRLPGCSHAWRRYWTAPQKLDTQLNKVQFYG